MQIVIANLIAIYRKELQGYFASPLAYGIAAIFWLLAGFFFVVILQNGFSAAAQANTQGQSFDMAYLVLQDFLSVIGFISLFILPILSMGLYAEERKRGTLELLATSPITNWIVALGKLLGVLTFYGTMVLPLLVYEAIAFGAAEPAVPLLVPLSAHLGLILMAASILSLGMFLSSLTDSTILAAILTFALVLFLWVIDGVAKTLPGPLGAVLSQISLLKHYTNLVQGVVETSALVLFASYIILGLFLTAQSIEALRFQRS